MSRRPGPSGRLVRIDLHNFTAGGVTVPDLTTINSSLNGFVGGFQDGRYGDLVPYNNGAPHGNLVRIELGNFSAARVTSVDLAAVDPALAGFSGGFSGGFANGKYGVMVPSYKLAVSGFCQKAVRIQLPEGAGTQ